MKIYLAGSVPKGRDDEQNFVNWRKSYELVLKKYLDAEYIDPYAKHLDESDYLSVFGNDCKHIKESDLILINAQEQLGAGTAQEMLIAKYFKKPVVTILPKRSHHRRENVNFFGKVIEDWIHPFIHSISDFIIEDIKDISKIKEEIFKIEAKDITVIDKAIEYVEK